MYGLILCSSFFNLYYVNIPSWFILQCWYTFSLFYLSLLQTVLIKWGSWFTLIEREDLQHNIEREQSKSIFNHRLNDDGNLCVCAWMMEVITGTLLAVHACVFGLIALIIITVCNLMWEPFSIRVCVYACGISSLRCDFIVTSYQLFHWEITNACRHTTTPAERITKHSAVAM